MLEVIGIVLAGLGIGIVVVVVVGALRLRRMRRGHRVRIDAISPTHSSPAVLFGLASDRTHQTRGVGTLAMSDARLLFVQLVPDREIAVDRADVTSVQRSRTFMGQSATRDLLVVTWETHGLGDAAAFSPEDVDDWLARLDA